MKNLIFILILFFTFQVCFSQSSFYDVSGVSGNGLRFWGMNEYKIHMGVGAEYQYGPVTDYSIKMNMNSGSPARGWTWGVMGAVPVAALSSAGNMQIAGNFKLQSTSELELGVGITKEVNAGKIGYQKFSTDALDFVGAGTTAANRKMKFWAEGGSNFMGNVDVAGTINATNVLINGTPIGGGGGGGSSQWATIGTTINYSGGYVGIGTATPLTRLHLAINGASTNYGSYAAGDISLLLQNTNTTASNLNLLSFADGNGYGVADVGTITNHTAHSAKLFFATRPSGGQPTQRMLIDENGNVGIGTASPNQKLTVNGTIYGKEVKVDLSVPGPDYVFEESYALPSLDEVKAYIEANKHLPEIPSAVEMEKNGINVSEMNMMLLKKVEELTLYIIELDKKVKSLEKK